jgi:metal-dependent amidase/aminoacylase/carboxypeptidase family protein
MIVRMVREIAQSMGGDAEIDLLKGYPVLVNDEELGTRSRVWAEEYVGKENVHDLDLWMAAEDFAWYTHEVPGCFYRLGTRNEARGIIHGVHTPQFDIEESALDLSTGLMAWMAIQELQHG